VAPPAVVVIGEVVRLRAEITSEAVSSEAAA